VTRGGGNNSATTTPITNIQIKLLRSSNLSTARLFSGENKSVAKINVLHTVLSRPAKVTNLIVTATITTKNKNGNMDFRELCRNEKLRPRASTTQSAVPSSALRVSLRHIQILYRVTSNSRQQLRNSGRNNLVAASQPRS